MAGRVQENFGPDFPFPGSKGNGQAPELQKVECAPGHCRQMDGVGKLLSTLRLSLPTYKWDAGASHIGAEGHIQDGAWHAVVIQHTRVAASPQLRHMTREACIGRAGAGHPPPSRGDSDSCCQAILKGSWVIRCQCHWLFLWAWAQPLSQPFVPLPCGGHRSLSYGCRMAVAAGGGGPYQQVVLLQDRLRGGTHSRAMTWGLPGARELRAHSH